MTHLALPTDFNVATYFVDRHIAEARDQKVALECGEERVTYRQFFERVNGLGNVFKRLGVRCEERVALLLLDTPEFAYSFFGAIKIGAVAVPMNTMLTPREYEYVLNDSRARIVIVSESLLPQLQAIPKSNLRYLETVIVHGQAPEGAHSLQQVLSAASADLRAEPTNKDDAAFWLYSSGSTGRPKGCVHLHHDMVVCAE
ncbi:MAG TPA: AMP-binding protein, partial [Pyrinomonadaceae bacterium]|nr:AMP-binding protein [Pyrinomonadaceae bacterium]